MKLIFVVVYSLHYLFSSTVDDTDMFIFRPVCHMEKQ